MEAHLEARCDRGPRTDPFQDADCLSRVKDMSVLPASGSITVSPTAEPRNGQGPILGLSLRRQELTLTVEGMAGDFLWLNEDYFLLILKENRKTEMT